MFVGAFLLKLGEPTVITIWEERNRREFKIPGENPQPKGNLVGR
jgi:hypothetical protein